MTTNPFPPMIVNKLAVESNTDPDTVRRVIRGQPVRPSTRHRIEQAAVRLKLVLPGSESVASDSSGAGVVSTKSWQSIEPLHAAEGSAQVERTVTIDDDLEAVSRIADGLDKDNRAGDALLLRRTIDRVMAAENGG